MIIDYSDLEIAQGTPQGIPFKANRVDGISPAVGLVFGPTDIKFGVAYVESNIQGQVFELGGGWYEYLPNPLEIQSVGPISIRTVRPDLYTWMSTTTVIAGTANTLPAAVGGKTSLSTGVGNFGFGF